jgi:hypothetical protein
MNRLIVSIFLLALLLVACTSSGEQATVPPEPDVAATDVARNEEPAEAPTGTEPPDEPTEAPADTATADTAAATATQEAQVAEQPTATAEPSPTTPPQATETPAPAFNGEYEGTYFRGLATAPITMIDYSDFL